MGRFYCQPYDGLAVLNPESVPADVRPPPIAIESCRVDRQLAPCEEKLILRPKDGALEIQYTAIAFLWPDQIQFRYKLVGLDADWVEAGTRRSATYSHLAPGNYVFQLAAANSTGFWTAKPATLRVVVLPRFYQTWWFELLITAALGNLMWLAFRRRTKQMQKQQAAQEAFARQLLSTQENERRRIAAELHDSLGQSLVLIRNWAELGSAQLEENASAREELGEIKTIAGSALKDVREIAYNLGPFHLERMGLANTIRDMVRKAMQASGISIETELDDIRGVFTRDIEMNLFRIAQEALNNLIKHSKASHAKITLKQTSSEVWLTISDNGQGFDAQRGAAPEVNGFGLSGIAERVRLLGGTHLIRSVVGQGATIEVWLNKGEQ